MTVLARALRNACKTLKRFLTGRRPRRRFGAVEHVERQQDVRPSVRHDNLVIVGHPDKRKWLVFLCPCGCGEVLWLNLMASHHPMWRIADHKDGTITVSPSVNAQKCGAHFWVRRNRVDWC